jgi:DNA invertase Pin-like site-specific DNA recombinase
MNAVIYARYSSHNQSEMSIEGQLKECYSFAKREGYTVIKEYIDRAKTGTSAEKRPFFQKMIADSARQQFSAIIVYQLDRFARNKYDSATYKARLSKNGVRVISARENLSEDASGKLMETLLEGMAAYYSDELSQKIKRGQAIAIEKRRHISGIVPLTFTIVILVMIVFGLRQADEANRAEGVRLLEEAILRAAVHSYAVGGYFPDSISYIEENFGIYIDRTRFIVHYEVFASNILPNIRVFELER